MKNLNFKLWISFLLLIQLFFLIDIVYLTLQSISLGIYILEGLILGYLSRYTYVTIKEKWKVKK